MKNWKLTAFIVTGIAIFTVSQDALAQSEELRMALRAFHDEPSHQRLESLSNDPTADLIAIARDSEELLLVRSRALLLLAHFPSQDVEIVLVEALGASSSALRRAAALALHRMMATTAPARLADHLAVLLSSSDHADREVAVRLLGELPPRHARHHLEARRIVERHRAVVEALRIALQ